MFPTPSKTLRGLAVLAAAAWLTAASAAGPAVQQAAANPSPEAVYQKERAACLRGTSPQDRATCLREAGAALAESRRARLGNGEGARDLARNAEQRCKNVAPADRDDCLRMARGEGTVSGSVDGGGVIKELVTVTQEPLIVVPAAPAASR
jgi:hypothetical protein